MRDAVRLAVGTLTRWPVPAPSAVDGATAQAAMLLAPWVGAALGTLAAALAWLGLRADLAPTLVAVLVVAALAYASRGLHLDGLADTADGLGSGGTAERALELMRRGDIGPIGAGTLILVLAVQVTALAQVLTESGPVPLVAAVAASRLAVTLTCLRGLRAARPDGLGAAVAGTVPRGQGAADAALVGLGATVLVLIVGVAVWAGAGAVLAAVVVSAALARVAGRRLGGITGDVLGGAVEVALAAALIVLALAGPA